MNSIPKARWLLISTVVFILVLFRPLVFGYPDPPSCTPSCSGWSCYSIGSVNSPGKLTFTNETTCLGSSATVPSLTNTIFNPGQESQTCTRSDCTTYQNFNSVTYTATNWWVPPIPAVFTNVGTFVFTNKVAGLSQNPDCTTSTPTVTGSTLTVTVVNPPPTITTQPVSQTNVADSGVTFTVIATSCTTMAYQWYLNGTPLPGAIASYLYRADIRTNDAGNYTVVISNSVGSVTSSVASLTVTLPSISWLQRYFGPNYLNDTNATATADPDADGINNLQEYLRGTDPTDFYNGALPILSIVSGNGQYGGPNQFLAAPLITHVSTNGVAMTNAPVTLTPCSYGISFFFGPVHPGDTYSVGATNFLFCQVVVENFFTNSPTAVEGIDYTQDPSSGTITILPGGSIADSSYLELFIYTPVSVNEVAASTNGTPSSNLSLRTDQSGNISAWVYQPYGFAFNNAIVVSAQTEAVSAHVAFAVNPNMVAEPLITTPTVWWGLPPWTYTAAQWLPISCSTPGAVIHYTLNGLDPTESDPVVTNGGVLVAYSEFLKVRAFKDDAYFPSGVGQVFLTISGGISAGDNHTLALRYNGSVWAAGVNGNGELGDSTFVNKSNLVNTYGLTSGFQAIAGGGSHSLALSNGYVYAWGLNNNGQLGDSSTVKSNVPVLVPGLSGVVSISAGETHSLALLSNGTVRAWGDNSNGELGDGNTNDKHTNTAVLNLTNASAISAGNLHSLAISNGFLWAWGNNAHGEIGDGTTTDRHVPTLVTNMCCAVAIAAGGQHCFAIINDQSLYAWGTNGAGQLGDGTNLRRLTPVRIFPPDCGLRAVAAGQSHSLALFDNGTVEACGLNNNGQLGIGSLQSQNYFTPVLGITNAVAIAAGESHSVALLADGTIMIWGCTNYGIPGAFSSVPVPLQPTNHLIYWNPPSIITQPQPQTNNAGSSVMFTVSAAGTSPLTYQWWFNNVSIPGATGAALVVPNCQYSDSGNYFVVVTNSCGSVTSAVANLTVLSPPVITAQPLDQNVLLGSNATFTVGGTGSSPLFYQWFHNSSALTGSTNATLTVTNCQVAAAGNYFAVLTNAYGAVTSSVAVLEVVTNAVGDSDYDGRNDGQEVGDGTDPNDPGSVLQAQLLHVTFDNTNTWVGTGGQLPLFTNNLFGLPDLWTNAVHIHGSTSAELAYRDVEANGNANINLRSGTVEFLFNPDWNSAGAGGTGPQNEGRFVEVGTPASTNGWWSLLVGSTGTNLYFCTQTNTGSAIMTNFTVAVSWTSNSWHQIALTYSPDSSAFYIDGLPVLTNGLGTIYWPGPTGRAGGFTIGSAGSGNNQAKGQFDELATFNYPRSAQQIMTDFCTFFTWEAADPSNPSLGLLKVWIDSPTNAAVIK